MSKFVKLTHVSGDPTWPNMTLAVGMTRNTASTAIIFGENVFTEVTETPEQILALIEGPSGEYEPF